MLTLSQAIAGFTLHIQARRLSQGTIATYTDRLARFAAAFPDDPALAAITVADVERFFAGQSDLSNSTLFGYHNTLSSLWTWAVENAFAPQHILHHVKRPQPEERSIDPFTEREVRAILQATRYSRDFQRPGQRATRQKLPDADRNEAIILTLLDTGLRRASPVSHWRL